MDYCSNFAKNLETIRTSRHKSLAEFSEELGVPKSTLQDIVAKDGKTSLYTATRIAGQLKVPLSTLTGEVVSEESLDTLSALLNSFNWFAFLSMEDQQTVTAHIRAIMEILQKQL